MDGRRDGKMSVSVSPVRPLGDSTMQVNFTCSAETVSQFINDIATGRDVSGSLVLTALMRCADYRVVKCFVRVTDDTRRIFAVKGIRAISGLPLRDCVHHARQSFVYKDKPEGYQFATTYNTMEELQDGLAVALNGVASDIEMFRFEEV